MSVFGTWCCSIVQTPMQSTKRVRVRQIRPQFERAADVMPSLRKGVAPAAEPWKPPPALM